MFVAAWKFDYNYGTRDQVMKAFKEFGNDKVWKSKSRRVLVGSIGAPESRIVVEYEFASLADLEASWDALRALGDAEFGKWVTMMRPLVVPGSPHWEVYRVIE